jgi:hypothetical protein
LDGSAEIVHLAAIPDSIIVDGISNPHYNTLGASINKITMTTFGKRETVGGRAQSILEMVRSSRPSRSLGSTSTDAQSATERRLNGRGGSWLFWRPPSGQVGAKPWHCRST